MSPPVIQLPLDLSGNAVTNKVTAELHIVQATGNRAFVTARGPFYSHTLVVRNNTTGAVLRPNEDYIAAHLVIEATQRSGNEVCSVILIRPTCHATDIEIDYQAIGGEYSASISTIEQLIESLDLDTREIHWGDILGTPEYFPPTAHLHDVGDLFGFEYLVAQLEAMRRAILLGDQPAFDELRNYVNRQDQILRADIDGFLSTLSEHIEDQNNPHNTTKSQVGLGNVDNFATATAAIAADGTSDAHFMTPMRTKELINITAGDTLRQHIGDLNNPHRVNKAQVGLNNLQNYPVSTQVEAEAGLGNSYMTATTTGQAVAALAVVPLNAHSARQDNPHAVSKTQVGLGAVDNFATANTTQAQAGLATDLFMTPATSRSLVMAVIGDSFNTHIARQDNPHAVTKAQVGLGNVENFKQIRNTTGNTVSMWWDGSYLKSQVDALPLGNVHTDVTPDAKLTAHLANGANPHNTTKAQVGLGSVENYPVADQAIAEAGASNAHYMTPWRTRQAVTIYSHNPLLNLIGQRIVVNSNAQVAALSLGSAGYMYPEGDGGCSLRVNGNRFFQFRGDGYFIAHNGRVIAGTGFQPSDKRFKKFVKKDQARPLWRDITFKTWTHKETLEVQKGVIAQELMEIAPDRVVSYKHGTGRRKADRFAVDYTGTAFEMAYAAGREVDALRNEVSELRQMVADLLKAKNLKG